MKKVIIYFLFLLGVIKCSAQLSTPFPVGEQGYHDFNEFLATEGLWFPTYGVSSNIIWNGTSAATGGEPVSGFTIPAYSVDQAYYCTSMTISSNVPVAFYLNQGYYSIGNYPQTFGSVITNGAVTIPINAVIKSYMRFPHLTIIDVPTADPASVLATTNTSGCYVTKSATTTVSTTFNTYSIIVTLKNNNGTSVTNPIVSDSLPPGCIFSSGAGTNFTVANNTPYSYTASYSGTIAAAGTATYTLTVQGIKPVSVSAHLNGYVITDDINYNAPPALWLGTSITWGVGATADSNNYTFMLRNYIRDTLGIDIRNVNKGVSGSQSSQLEFLRVYQNWEDFKVAPRIVVFEHGVNDFLQGIDTGTYKANILKTLTYCHRRYPNCSFLLLNPFPNGTSGTESGLVNYRAAMGNLYNYGISDLTLKARTYWVNTTSSVWNAATQSGTYTVDGTHPNNSGRVLIYNAIRNFIVANNIQF